MTPIFDSISVCRACGSERLVEILQFGEMPLANRLLAPPQLRDPEVLVPLTVIHCPQCSLVQIRETVRPEILFCEDYPYFSSVSDSWVEHCRRNVVELIGTRKLGRDSLVVEIASNDGHLLRHYAAAGVPVLGIDPAAGPAAAAREIGVPTRQEFFGKALAESLVAGGKRADVIHANNVFAHVADLGGVVEGIRILLQETGVAVIEAPYVRNMVEHCEFDTIYHEHLCYFSVTAVSKLFQRHGLVLVDVRQLPTHGGSLRMFVQHAGHASAAVERLLAEEQQLGIDGSEYYRGFADQVTIVTRSLKRLLESLRAEGKRVAGYGVAAKGAILLNAARIDGTLMEYVVDRSPHKQGKYMPGVRLPVYDPRKLLTDLPDYVLLMAWNFQEEIVKQQQEYLSKGGKFIVPIPTPRVLEPAAV